MKDIGLLKVYHYGIFVQHFNLLLKKIKKISYSSGSKTRNFLQFFSCNTFLFTANEMLLRYPCSNKLLDSSCCRISKKLCQLVFKKFSTLVEPRLTQVVALQMDFNIQFLATMFISRDFKVNAFCFCWQQ